MTSTADQFGIFLENPSKETFALLNKEDTDLLLITAEQIIKDKRDITLANKETTRTLNFEFASNFFKYIGNFIESMRGYNSLNTVDDDLDTVDDDLDTVDDNYIYPLTNYIRRSPIWRPRKHVGDTPTEVYILHVGNLVELTENKNPLEITKLTVEEFILTEHYCGVCIDYDIERIRDSYDEDESRTRQKKYVKKLTDVREIYEKGASTILNRFENLETLIIGEDFLGDLNNLNLPKLTELRFLGNYRDSTRDMILPNLKYLELMNPSCADYETMDFPKLETLKVDDHEFVSSAHIFCSDCSSLDVDDREAPFNFRCHEADSDELVGFINQFPSLRRLENTIDVSLSGLNLPNLTHLVINYRVDRPLDFEFPNLTYIVFDRFDLPLSYLNQDNFPHLSYLDLGFLFNQPLDDLDLPNLTNLVLGPIFKHPIPKKLLKQLSHLTIGGRYLGSIEEFRDNKNLKVIYI